MARHYSTKSFFRQTPNALLGRYFQERGYFADLDFSAMKEGNPEALFSAWLDLPDSLRNTMDAEFVDIFALCCEKGFLAIIDEAKWQLRENPELLTAFVEKLSVQDGYFERAMITFLDHRNFWQGATRFYHADTLTFWRKRKNFTHLAAAVDDDSLSQLADMIRNYFHHTEGRGKNCVVEAYRRDELDYYFCYPEDHSKQSIEWVDGKFDPRPHTPAFEVVYVYSQKEGTLDLNYHGAYKAIEPLQVMFAAAILKIDDLPPDPKDERVYDLNLLSNRNFEFIYNVGSGIESVAVKKFRISSWIKKGDRITLEADTSHDPDAIYQLIEKISKSLPLHLYNVTQVEIAVSAVTEIGKPAKSYTIRITHPNSCSLKYDELDLKFRDMLEASGIELREPPETRGDVQA